MPAGSVVVFAGTLLHRGGANTTDRTAARHHAAVLRAVARQQEPMMLVAGAAAADYPPALQSLLGYSIHPPFMGHIGGRHPLKTLPARAAGRRARS